MSLDSLDQYFNNPKGQGEQVPQPEISKKDGDGIVFSTVRISGSSQNNPPGIDGGFHWTHGCSLMQLHLL